MLLVVANHVKGLHEELQKRLTLLVAHIQSAIHHLIEDDFAVMLLYIRKMLPICEEGTEEHPALAVRGNKDCEAITPADFHVVVLLVLANHQRADFLCVVR